MEIQKIKCPHCGKLSEYVTTNAFRPFCSERCQLIDLGDWASEKYAVPGEKQSPNSEDPAQVEHQNTSEEE